KSAKSGSAWMSMAGWVSEMMLSHQLCHSWRSSPAEWSPSSLAAAGLTLGVSGARHGVPSGSMAARSRKYSASIISVWVSAVTFQPDPESCTMRAHSFLSHSLAYLKDKPETAQLDRKTG